MTERYLYFYSILHAWFIWSSCLLTAGAVAPPWLGRPAAPWPRRTCPRRRCWRRPAGAGRAGWGPAGRRGPASAWCSSRGRAAWRVELQTKVHTKLRNHGEGPNTTTSRGLLLNCEIFAWRRSAHLHDHVPGGAEARHPHPEEHPATRHRVLAQPRQVPVSRRQHRVPGQHHTHQ